MSRPARLDTRYTKFDRLVALWDRVAELFRGRRTPPRQTARLAVEAMEDRLVPTAAAVWLGPDTQLLPEGASGGIWAYRSGGDTTQPLTVQLSFGSNGTADPLAAWNADYTLTGPSGGSGGSSVSLGASGGTVTFGANETALFLNLRALRDNLVEGTEGFRVTVLDGGTNYQPGWGSGGSGGSGGWDGSTADIRIADVAPVIALSPETLSVWEGASGGIGLSRSGGDTTLPLTVQLGIGANGLSDPLAAWNTDYTLTGPSGGSGGSSVSLGASGGTVTFGANETQVELTLAALLDIATEPTEGFRVTVLEGDGGNEYLIGWGSGGSSGGSGGSGGFWAGETTDVRILDPMGSGGSGGSGGSETSRSR
jgi:hypothetical protein